MVDKVMDLLVNGGALQNLNEFIPITLGASGAHVFSVDEKYIVKYTNMLEHDSNSKRLFQKEYDFYKLCDNNFDFIPKVVFQCSNENEFLIIFKKYHAIRRNEWTSEIQSQAMEMCARIHAASTDDFVGLFQENNTKQWDASSRELDDSLESWLRLQRKFPDSIDSSLLYEMRDKFDEVISNMGQVILPKTLCHGDYHPDHFLQSGNKLLICDWQNVGIGTGVGDVAFFISRGADMGLNINRDELITAYTHYLLKHAKIKIDRNDILKHIAASEFDVSFKFWANYLQASSLKRVMKLYTAMVDSYNTLL